MSLPGAIAGGLEDRLLSRVDKREVRRGPSVGRHVSAAIGSSAGLAVGSKFGALVENKQSAFKEQIAAEKTKLYRHLRANLNKPMVSSVQPDMDYEFEESGGYPL